MKKVKVVCFGEILWDNLITGRRLGGAPLNVCYHLKKMGVESTIITRIGNDAAGRDLLVELKKLSIDSSFCNVTDKWPTSTVEVHLKANHEVEYEIVENVAWDAIDITPEMIAAVKEADAFVFGSLVTRNEQSRNTLFELMDYSRYRVFDANLRAPFYSSQIITRLLKRTQLLKLNEDELSIIMEWLEYPDISITDQLQQVQHAFPSIEQIILTRGAAGSLYYSNGQIREVNALKVEVKDTVGSGDAFLAAFLAETLSGNSPSSALKQASRLSGFIAAHSGACPEYSKEDLLAFEQSI